MSEDPGTAPGVTPDPSAEEPTVVVIGAPAPETEIVPGPSRAPEAAGPSRAPEAAGPSRAPEAAGPSRAPHVAPPERRRALMPWAIVLGAVVLLGAAGLVLTYTP